MRKTRVLSGWSRALALTLALALPAQAPAQSSPFSAAITVNGRAISGFEIQQRVELLRMFRTPGALEDLAVEQLIDDRLKSQELERVGLQISEESLRSAMEEFAERANLSLEQFVTVLNQNGVDETALRDFVQIGISWRDYARSRYNSRINITEAEVDAALGLASASSSGIEVLLSEIIIPAPPPQAAQAMAVAERISRMTTTGEFEAAAREYSALPTRDQGGRLGWLPLSNYPPQLRTVILGLAPGQVTPPIQIENGVALLQLRDVREVAVAPQAPALIDYAAFYIPGGRGEAALQQARTLANRVDTCDDLYGVAHGQPPEVLDRQNVPPAQIPQDLALELAKLDPNEVSYALTSADGQVLIFLMMCQRTPASAVDVDRETVRLQLRSDRIAGYADALVADLRASATIVYH